MAVLLTIILYPIDMALSNLFLKKYEIFFAPAGAIFLNIKKGIKRQKERKRLTPSFRFVN